MEDEMARRAYGHGAIYRRADGRWEAQLRLAAGGRKSFYGKTRREAATKLAEVSWMIASQLPVRCGRLTVAQYLDDWLEVTRRRVRPSTIVNYELNVKRLGEHLGVLPLTRLNPPRIQATYDALANKGLSAYSVLQAHRTLSRALTQAMHWGLIPRNPAATVFPPKPQPRETKGLTVKEMRVLIKSTRGDRFHALWLVLGTAGLRLGEALGLTWDQVDLSSGRLHVRKALQRQRTAGNVFVPCKTRTSRRTVILTRLALRALRLHLRRQSALPASTHPWAHHGLVFSTSAGGPLDQARPNLALRRALDRAGLPRIRIHDLRHSAASALLADGVHPKVVQEFLGHSSIKVTMDVYSHVMPTMHAEAIRRLDLILRGDDPADDTDEVEPSAA
jgi:integrase